MPHANNSWRKHFATLFWPIASPSLNKMIEGLSQNPTDITRPYAKLDNCASRSRFTRWLLAVATQRRKAHTTTSACFISQRAVAWWTRRTCENIVFRYGAWWVEITEVSIVIVTGSAAATGVLGRYLCICCYEIWKRHNWSEQNGWKGRRTGVTFCDDVFSAKMIVYTVALICDFEYEMLLAVKEPEII